MPSKSKSQKDKEELGGELRRDNLIPVIPKKFLEFNGKITYDDSYGAFNTIKFKKNVLDVIDSLKKKTGDFFYEGAGFFSHSSEEAQKVLIEKLQKDGFVFVMSFYQGRS